MLPSSFLLLACLTRAVPPEVNGKICAAPPLLEAGMHPKQVEGPLAVDSASVKAWLQALKRFRKDCQADIGFNGSAFELDALKWTQTAYAGPQMHTYDRMFYDPALGNGTNGHGYTGTAPCSVLAPPSNSPSLSLCLSLSVSLLSLSLSPAPPSTWCGSAA